MIMSAISQRQLRACYDESEILLSLRSDDRLRLDWRWPPGWRCPAADDSSRFIMGGASHDRLSTRPTTEQSITAQYASRQPPPGCQSAGARSAVDRHERLAEMIEAGDAAELAYRRRLRPMIRRAAASRRPTGIFRPARRTAITRLSGFRPLSATTATRQEGLRRSSCRCVLAEANVEQFRQFRAGDFDFMAGRKMMPASFPGEMGAHHRAAPRSRAADIYTPGAAFSRATSRCRRAGLRLMTRPNDQRLSIGSSRATTARIST